MGRRKIIEDEQLLAQARDIFMREGISVGSRQIAQEIGISSSVLFQRFGSKEELFFAAMTPPAPDLTAMLSHDPADAPETQVERVAAGLLEYFRQLGPVLAALSTHPSFHYPSFAARHPASSLETLIGALMAAMADRHRTGEINCPDVGPVVLNLVAVAYALAMFERMGAHDGQFDEHIVRAVAGVLWRGIAPCGPRQPTGAPDPESGRGSGHAAV